MFDAIQSILSAFSSDVERVARRSRRDLVMLGLAILFGLTAYVAGIAALAIYGASLFGPIGTLISIGLAAIFAMLVVIALQHTMKDTARKEAARADAQLRIVTTLSAALLPMLAKSKIGSTAALVGGLAFVANQLLKPASRPAPRPQPPRRHLPPAYVNGAVNPYLQQDREKEIAR